MYCRLSMLTQMLGSAMMRQEARRRHESSMNGSLSYVVTALVLFVSTLTRSTLGFGDALVAMPLLVLALGIQTAAPVVALVATTIALVILWSHWRHVELQALGHLLVASALGIPVGLVLVKRLPEPILQGVLGVIIIVFSLYSLLEPQFVIRQHRPGLAYGFGFVAGVLGGAYNTIGPLVVMYGQLRRWPPTQFRATLQGFFFPAYLFIVIGHGVVGLLTPQVLALYGLSLPMVALAIVLGGKLHAAIPRAQFTRVVNIALVLIGLMLCIRSLR